MNKVKRTKYYKSGDEWFVDKVPISTSLKQRITSVTYIGLCEHYLFSFKNGNTQHRWRTIDSLAPDADVWFMMSVHTDGELSSDFFKHIMVVSIVNDELHYEWVSERLMRPSNNKMCPKKLSILEAALIEFSIEKALGGEE